ncbi:peroxinectin [Tieghemostelium lacteum]|uniref:Peroxinectin n=1 Tax=Tieghemostelium lacteum TaxID=361077 RepID=A0A151Z3I6_TIELA|nr:peroxinectin [Tieghemostelium lacteum]|eukprot:KYQ88509.1 peroxinectin [Tieghemostelium lacteum]
MKSIFYKILLILLVTLQFSYGIEWRSFNGEGNNLVNPKYGVLGIPYQRLAKQRWPMSPNTTTGGGQDLPNVRMISNNLCQQNQTFPSSRRIAYVFNLFGQFITHSMTQNSNNQQQRYGIKIPKCDTSFDPNCTGNVTMGFSRSKIVEVDCSISDKYIREQDGKCYEHVNTLSSYIDGNVVYGSSKNTSDKLRLFECGLMNSSSTQFGEFPPKGISGVIMFNDAKIVPDSELFSCGESRANENIGLTSLHTLFLREHNRQARIFKWKNPDWSDEDLFQHSRSCVIGQIQKILNEEYLPILLGRSWGGYTGYSCNVDSSLYTEFNTAAFRFPHSEVPDHLSYLDENGTEIDRISVRNMFTNPPALVKYGVEAVYRGIIYAIEEEIDTHIVSDIRNFLFGKPGQGGLDLFALDLNRNRENAIASYNAMRRELGLRPARQWSDISSKEEVQKKLSSIYSDINQVEVLIGAMSEDKYRDSLLGETFYNIVYQQFYRTKKGDRFWYEVPQMRELNEKCELTTFSKLFKRNTHNIGPLPKKVFVVPKKTPREKLKKSNETYDFTQTDVEDSDYSEYDI